MAKKKDDVDLDFEDEDEEAEDDEYGDEDADEDEDADFDEEDDDEEEGGKKGGGGAIKVMLLVVLFLGAIGAGAFAFMSSGGSLDILANVPVIGQYFAKPKPVSFAPPSGFVNPNLETRKPATDSPAVATGALAANPAAAPAASAAAPAVPPAVKPAAPVAAAPKPAGPAPKPAPVAAAPKPVEVAAAPEPAEPAAAPAPREVKKVKSHRKGGRYARPQRKTREHRTWRTANNWASTGSSHGAFSVQVGAFSQPSNAERLIASLKSQGYPAYGTGGGARGTMVHGGQFHVRSNVVDSRQKANQLANQFRLAGWSPRVVPLSGGQYVLHLGTFGSQEQASGLVADLNAKGLFATVSGRVGARVGVAAPSGGGPNRVWVGHFGNRSEAEAMASRLRSSVGAAIVVRR